MAWADLAGELPVFPLTSQPSSVCNIHPNAHDGSHMLSLQAFPPRLCKLATSMSPGSASEGQRSSAGASDRKRVLMQISKVQDVDAQLVDITASPAEQNAEIDEKKKAESTTKALSNMTNGKKRTQDKQTKNKKDKTAAQDKKGKTTAPAKQVFQCKTTDDETIAQNKMISSTTSSSTVCIEKKAEKAKSKQEEVVDVGIGTPCEELDGVDVPCRIAAPT